jgi:hypothetical protein
MSVLGTPENEQQFSIARSQQFGVSIIYDHSRVVFLTKVPENRDSFTQRHHSMDEDQSCLIRLKWPIESVLIFGICRTIKDLEFTYWTNDIC